VRVGAPESLAARKVTVEQIRSFNRIVSAQLPGDRRHSGYLAGAEVAVVNVLQVPKDRLRKRAGWRCILIS